MQELISRTGEDRCASCGMAFTSDREFCPNCGIPVLPRKPPPRDVEPGDVLHETFKPSTPSAWHPRKPWGLIGLLIMTGVAIVVLAGWLVSVNGRLGETKTTLARERSRVEELAARAASLDGQLDDAIAESRALVDANASLETAMVDCKDAALKTRQVLKTAFLISQGRASLTDFRSAARVAQGAWSVCRTEAATNGSL